jgi:hypothetical protein
LIYLATITDSILFGFNAVMTGEAVITPTTAKIATAAFRLILDIEVSIQSNCIEDIMHNYLLCGNFPSIP